MYFICTYVLGRDIFRIHINTFNVVLHNLCRGSLKKINKLCTYIYIYLCINKELLRMIICNYLNWYYRVHVMIRILYIRRVQTIDYIGHRTF